LSTRSGNVLQVEIECLINRQNLNYPDLRRIQLYRITGGEVFPVQDKNIVNLLPAVLWFYGISPLPGQLLFADTFITQ